VPPNAVCVPELDRAGGQMWLGTLLNGIDVTLDMIQDVEYFSENVQFS
jgi:hypothetical protein